MTDDRRDNGALIAAMTALKTELKTDFHREIDLVHGNIQRGFDELSQRVTISHEEREAETAALHGRISAQGATITTLQVGHEELRGKIRGIHLIYATATTVLGLFLLLGKAIRAFWKDIVT